ncbi:MAG: GNAT family N-acetyltransferase [Pseudomonadota bacterium]
MTSARSDNKAVRWHCSDFESLGVAGLYRLLRERVAVFVVEQTCPYQELDDLDAIALHLWAEDSQGQVLAIARLLPPGASYSEPSIGRVLTTAAGRGLGLGRALMEQALANCEQRYPGQGIRISAQQYLETFYRDLGFETIRGPYLEDDIPHLEMLRPPT